MKSQQAPGGLTWRLQPHWNELSPKPFRAALSSKKVCELPALAAGQGRSQTACSWDSLPVLVSGEGTGRNFEEQGLYVQKGPGLLKSLCQEKRSMQGSWGGKE